MTKTQWKNLYHAYRWMKRYCTLAETIAWIAQYSFNDAIAILKARGEV